MRRARVWMRGDSSVGPTRPTRGHIFVAAWLLGTMPVSRIGRSEMQRVSRNFTYTLHATIGMHGAEISFANEKG